MKILFTDVDDTICPSTKPVGAPMVQALRSLADRGVQLVFISGSTVEQIQEQISVHLNRGHALLGATGTHAVRWEPGPKIKEIYKEGLDDASRKKVLQVIRGLVDRHHLKPMTNSDDQIQDRGSQVTFSIIGRHAPDEAKRNFDSDGSKRRVWVKELQEELGNDFEIRVGGTTSIDVTPSGCDKGWAIKRYLGYAGFKPADAIFIGDQLEPGGNDYPARRVLRSLSVANPQETVKLINSIVKKSLDISGFEFLELVD